MRRLCCTVMLVLLAAAGAAVHAARMQPQPPGDTGLTVLAGATVIDGTGAAPRPDTTIVISGDRVAYVGPSSGFRASRNGNSKILQLKGRWIVPGFIDTHGHLPGVDGAAEFLRQLVAFGTTTLRAPSNPRTELRDLIERGVVVGPRLRVAGTLIDGPESAYTWAVRVSTEAEIRSAVRRQIAEKVDFIKLYCGIAPDLARAAVQEAHQGGVRVIGHVGRMTWSGAAEIGVDSLAHSWYAGLAHSVVPPALREEFREFYIPNPRFNPALFRKWRDTVTVNSPEVLQLADQLREQHVEVHPNLVLGEAVTWGDDASVLERLEPGLAPPETAAGWRRARHPYSQKWSAEAAAEAKLAFPLMVAIVRVFHERGVLLAAGTDYMNPWMTPGVAFHRELELLASAGIRPLDVLRIATRNGAEALGLLGETGTIERGKCADLVVLSADPLVSISNTRKIDRVFLRGRPFTPHPGTHQ